MEIRTTDYHTAGEPFRIVAEGVVEIPGASVGARRGALRVQIEAVRVREDLRGRGLGHALIAWAIEEARRLGFTATHEGFKLRL